MSFFFVQDMAYTQVKSFDVHNSISDSLIMLMFNTNEGCRVQHPD
jgi:hypothetical protein